MDGEGVDSAGHERSTNFSDLDEEEEGEEDVTDWKHRKTLMIVKMTMKDMTWNVVM